MKRISVNTKVVVSLGLSLILIFGVMAVVNGYQQSRSLSELYFDNSVALDWALGNQISEIMVNGQNEKLQPLTEEIVSKGVLQELSIIDDQRMVKRSSNKGLVGKTTADASWSAALASGHDTTFTADVDGTPVLVGFKVFHNGEACNQCHDSKDQPVLGSIKSVVSQKPMQAAITKGVGTNILLSLLGAGLLIGGIVIVLRKQVFGPLADVTAKLELAEQGRIDQTITAKSDDEIGRLLKAIQGLVDYIKAFATASTRVAEGDLRVSVKPRSDQDQLGMAFSRMIENLTAMIRKIEHSSTQLTSAVASIRRNSGDVASSAHTQADQVRQVSAAVEEMAASASETSNNTSAAAKVAERATSVAGEGASTVDETVSGMQRIQAKVNESSRTIKDLADSAERISDIVAMIDDISNQTNLLALNAAIEAARAGEQGRGFAVVADEVRKLADKTGKATAQIVDMIAQIRNHSESAVSAMGSMVVQVDDGKNLVAQAGENLTQLVSMVEQVSHTIQQIAAAAREQSVAAEEVSRNIEAISSATEGTVNNVNESQDTCGRLGKQAEELNELVKQFHLTN